jgi:hypothetical protein
MMTAKIKRRRNHEKKPGGGEEFEYQFPFFTQDNNIAAGGSPMIDLFLWAISNWP